MLTRNKKVVLVSVGVLLLLIASVILFRHPAKDVEQAESPPVTSMPATPEPAPTASGQYDNSHERIGKVIDDATAALVERAPGWWDKIVSWGDWFMGFKTKHAIIMILVAFFILGIVLNPKNRNNSHHH